MVCGMREVMQGKGFLVRLIFETSGLHSIIIQRKMCLFEIKREVYVHVDMLILFAPMCTGI